MTNRGRFITLEGVDVAIGVPGVPEHAGVLPVGGINEKVLAARRAGVREVILPRLNENDLVDIAPEIRDELQFLFVDHVDQVLALSLLPAAEAEAQV